MTKLTYAQQLKHPNWQKRRLEMLERAEWKCQECGCKETTLHVHHKRYVKGRMAWEYGADELAVLCEDCHEEEHAITAELNELLSHINSTQALALLKGFHAKSDWFDQWIGDMGRDRNPLMHAVGFTAFLMEGLGIHDMHAVAKFAVSKLPEHAEARLILESNGWIYGEE